MIASQSPIDNAPREGVGYRGAGCRRISGGAMRRHKGDTMKKTRRCDTCRENRADVAARYYGDGKHEPAYRCDKCHRLMLEYWAAIRNGMRLA
jgi:hypothetical protein